MSDKNSTPGAGQPPSSGATEAKPQQAHDPASKPAGTGSGTPQPTAPAPASSTPSSHGLPDLEAHTEAPQWLSGDHAHDGHLWSRAFDADVPAAQDDGAVAAEDSGEPTLTNPDDVILAEPSLDSPDISSEAAESASLEDAEAEVLAVEAEAADAAVLTDPVANRPAAVDHTAGIAAAAPMTEDQQGVGADADAVKPPAESLDVAQPAEPAQTRRSRRDAEPSAAGERGAGDGAGGAGDGSGGSRGSGGKRILLIIGVLGILAVLVILLFTVLGQSEKAPGVLQEHVATIDLEQGSCLQDFTEVNEPTTVVTCETPHNAQLVATAAYQDSDAFPGAEALSARATEICSQVRYSKTVTDNPTMELQEKKVIPTQASWNDGDRRIDCFVASSGDRDLTASLLEQ